MFLSDSQMALNSLIQAMEDSVILYENYVDYLQDEALVKLLNSILDRREQHLRILFNVIKVLGELPKAPNIEADSIQALFSRLKAGLSPDESITLLGQLITKQTEILELTRRAKKEDLSEDIQRSLSEIEEQLTMELKQLNAAHSDHQ